MSVAQKPKKYSIDVKITDKLKLICSIPSMPIPQEYTKLYLNIYFKKVKKYVIPSMPIHQEYTKIILKYLF